MFALTLMLLALIAALYASVGHGGASGYIAVLTLMGHPPEIVRATALSLNVVVASIALAKFARRTELRLDLLVPFALSAVPCAFLAGRFLSLDERAYRVAIALVLLFAAWRLSIRLTDQPDGAKEAPPAPASMVIGASIGLVSGLIGVGGGIFLSPVLILMGWASAREAAGVSAAFIIVSSIAGLLGFYLQLGTLPLRVGEFGAFAACVGVGGFVGASVGVSRFNAVLLRRTLSVVMLMAALKLLFT